MSQQKILISVYDNEINKTIIENKEIKEAAESIGIPYKTLYNSVNRNTLVKKRYMVNSVSEVIKKVKHKKGLNDYFTQKELLQFKCEDVIEAARRLRNGGKIVCKGGKKYVEGGLV